MVQQMQWELPCWKPWHFGVGAGGEDMQEWGEEKEVKLNNKKK